MAMTKAAFNETMQSLIEVFGERKFSPGRIKVLWESINDLDDAWLRIFAKRMIAEYNDQLNIVDAARGERRARADIDRATQVMITAPTPDGSKLRELLAEKGAKSLTDLIFKPAKESGTEEQT